MVKTGDEKGLNEALTKRQKEKGTYDSPCMSVCDYEGLFNQCRTCKLRKVEKKLWKENAPGMKDTILRAINKRE